MDFSKLFKLEKESNISEELTEENLKGKEDSEIRKIILDNFPKLFSYLELFNEGKQYSLPVFKKHKRPDSLAFCENEKRLYILEYKSRIDDDLIKQVREYRDGLQKSQKELYDLVFKWNEQVDKHRKPEYFKNNKAKILCIAPEFDEHAIGVEEGWEEEIYLIKITKYKDKEGNYFALLQSRYPETINSLIDNKNGVEGLSNRSWMERLKEWVNQEIEPLATKNYLNKKGRRGGTGWDFGKVNQEIIFSICFRSRWNFLLKPNIFLVNPSIFLIEKWQLESPNEQGSHFYYVETKTNDGWLKAKQLITEFIKEKS